MFVRAIYEQDGPSVAAMAENLAHESPVFSKFTFSYDRVMEFIGAAQSKEDPYVTAFVVEHDNEVVGFLGAYISGSPFFSDDLAWDAAIYVAPEFRGRVGIKALRSLMLHYRLWAATHKVSSIRLGVLTGINTEKTIKLFEHLGWKRIGAILEYG